MKKTLFFSALVVLMSGLVFAGCNKDKDKDEPSTSEEPSLDPSKEPANEYARKIAGHFYWGDANNNSEGWSAHWGELAVSADGLQAVLTAQGEVPLVLDLEFDKDGNITLSGTDNEFFGKIEDLEMEVSDSGDKVIIRGKTDFYCIDGYSWRIGDYVFELDLQPRAQGETYIDLVAGNTFVADHSFYNGLRQGFFYNGASEMRLVFSNDRKTALLTTAGECPMTINYTVDAWDNFTMKGVDVNEAWTVGNGLTGYWLDNSDRLTPAMYYGEIDEAWITGFGNNYFHMHFANPFDHKPVDVNFKKLSD